MDMAGQGRIIRPFSEACRNLIPLLDDDSYKQGSKLARQIVKPTLSHSISNDTDGHPAPPPLPKCTWINFTFHPTSLTALKSLATEKITLPSSYISTDDALGAFI